MKLKTPASNQTELTLTTIPKGIADFSTEVTILFSYQTPVAAHVQGVGFFKTNRKWSPTTSKHITQFIVRHGGSAAIEVDQDLLNSLVNQGAVRL